MARRKARQLESFDAVPKRHKSTDDDNGDAVVEDGEPAPLVRREGEQHMINFLEAVKQAGPDVAMAELERLRAELFAHNNAYVRSVLRVTQ